MRHERQFNLHTERKYTVLSVWCQLVFSAIILRKEAGSSLFEEIRPLYCTAYIIITLEFCNNEQKCRFYEIKYIHYQCIPFGSQITSIVNAYHKASVGSAKTRIRIFQAR